jgi:4,5-dihydroxyphthalate decarboxylase
VLKLNMATIYYPYFGKLLDGTYTSHDVELTWHYVTPPDKLFRQVIESSTYDVAEMSMSGYTMLRDKGWREYVALPIFTSRRFRHSALFVRSDSEIVSGEQLAGKKVGLPEYHMTAAVWVRGILEEDFGVKPEQIQWFTGGAERPGRKERIELPREIAARITRIAADETLFNMLLDGRLDAVMCAHRPALARERPARVRQLFPDCPQVERNYYRKHGIFPIMHTLVLRQSLLQKENNIAERIHLIVEELKRVLREGRNPETSSGLSLVRRLHRRDRGSHGKGSMGPRHQSKLTRVEQVPPFLVLPRTDRQKTGSRGAFH